MLIVTEKVALTVTQRLWKLNDFTHHHIEVILFGNVHAACKVCWGIHKHQGNDSAGFLSLTSRFNSLCACKVKRISWCARIFHWTVSLMSVWSRPECNTVWAPFLVRQMRQIVKLLRFLMEVLPTSEHLVGVVALPLSLLQLPKQSVTPNVSGVPTTCQSILSWIQTVKDCNRHRLLSTLQGRFPYTAQLHWQPCDHHILGKAPIDLECPDLHHGVQHQCQHQQLRPQAQVVLQHQHVARQPAMLVECPHRHPAIENPWHVVDALLL